jgi:hypothetical protein
MKWKNKKQCNTECWQECESDIADKNAKWCNQSGKQLDSFLKYKHATGVQACNGTPRHKCSQQLYSWQQKLETTQMSFNN